MQTTVLRGIYASMFAVHAFEARTSLDALNAGGREVDPFMRPFISNHTAFVLANLARAAAVDFGIHSVAKHHRIVAIAIGVALDSVYLAAASHNRRVADMMSRQATPPAR